MASIGYKSLWSSASLTAAFALFAWIVTLEASENEIEKFVANFERRSYRLESQLSQMDQQIRAHSNESSNWVAKLKQIEVVWSNVANRLELLERFVAVASSKLYETEERVKELEKCDCRQACHWSSSKSISNSTGTIKSDGETWTDQCDVCTCHRGKVKCRHVDCPPLKCLDPQHLNGHCCPICFVKHGQKLVINSNQETCKECLCINGRFKCQRIELENFNSNQTSKRRSQRAAFFKLKKQNGDLNEDLEANRKERLEQEDEENEDEDGFENENEIYNERRHKRTVANTFHKPLVCPSLDCPIEEQFRLSNDCCTYCRNFDFCSQRASFRCHPKAICINKANETINLTIKETSKLSDDLIDCKCPIGYIGDGRFCQDIDECSDVSLNGCNLNTTTCVNLPGSYKCQCKKGFRAMPRIESQPQVSLEVLHNETNCVDLDECADGKFNRCHTLAKCINLLGSYKCQCKNGYIGNGLECHQWFSSEPNVATYLHRHSPELTKLSNRPIYSLQDFKQHDTDDDDQSNLQYENRNYLEDNGSNGNNDLQLPKLSESKWEPLQFDHGSGSQQFDLNNVTINDDNRFNLESIALNTRTMFFQPPPRFRPQYVTTKETPKLKENDSNPNFIANVDAKTTKTANGDSSRSDTNKSVYIQPSSDFISPTDLTKQQTTNTTYQSNQINSRFSNEIGNVRLTQQAESVLGTQMPQTKQLASGYKRGTIIASGTTSMNRANGKMSYSSSSQHYKSTKSASVTSDALSKFDCIMTFDSTSKFKIDLVRMISINNMILFILPAVITNYYINFNHIVTIYLS